MLFDMDLVVVHLVYLARFSLFLGEHIFAHGFVALAVGDVRRALPISEAEQLEHARLVAFAHAAVLVLQNAQPDQFEHHIAPACERVGELVVRLEGEVFRGEGGGGKALELQAAVVAGEAHEALFARELLEGAQNEIAHLSHAFAQRVGGGGEAGVVLLHEQRDRPSRHGRISLRILGKLGDAADGDELGEQPLLLIGKVARDVPGRHDMRRGAALAVDEHLPGRQTLALQLVHVHRTVLDGEHAHGEPVHIFMLAVAHVVICPLQGNEPFDDRGAEDAAHLVKAAHLRERIAARAVFFVDIGQYPVIEQLIPRHDAQPAFGALARGQDVAFDDDAMVLDERGIDARYPRRIARARGERRAIERKDVHLFALHLFAPDVAHFVDVVSLGVNERAAVVYLSREQIVGEDLEGRDEREGDVPLAYLSPLFVLAHERARVRVPAHLDKAAARRLAPGARRVDELDQPRLFLRGFEHLGRELGAIDVVVVVARGTHGNARLDARELGKAGLHHGRYLVIHLALLPIIALAVILDVPLRSYLAILIAREKIHVQPPLQLERLALLPALFKVRFHFIHDLLSKLTSHSPLLFARRRF